MKRAITALSFISAAALFTTAGSAQTVPVAGEVVINAVYGGGGNATARLRYDYVELFNRSTTAKDVSGFTLQRGSATATFPGVTPTVAANVSLGLPSGTVLQPGQYLLVRMASGANTSLTDLPTPFIDNTANGGGLTLGATGGKMALVSNATILTSWTSPSVIDFVSWGGSGTTGGEANPAPLLTNSTAIVRNNGGCDDTDNSFADFSIADTLPLTFVPRTSASPFNVCGLPVPDLALTLASGNCGLTSGSSVTLVASASNPGTAAANGAVVTITLPSSVTNVAAPGAAVVGNVITWLPGNLAVGAGPVNLNITATVNAQGTFVATASAPTLLGEVTTANNNVGARNFVAFSGAGYNTTVTPLFAAVPAAYETANSFNAGLIGLVSDTFGTPLKARSLLGRPVASANGSRFMFWANTEVGDAGGTFLNLDGVLVAGSISGGSASLTTIAAESATAVDPANPTRVVRAGVSFPASITAPAINNAGDFLFATQTIGGAETIPTSVVASGNVSNPTAFTVVARQGEASTLAGPGVNWGPAAPTATTSVFNATTLTNAGAASFTGTLSGTGVTGTNDFIAVNGGAVGARKGVTVPAGLAGTNAGSVITSIEASTAAANGYSVDASGNNVLVSGVARLTGTGTAADDAFVSVNGNVVLQEGFPIGGSGITDNVASFDSSMMQPDGSWYTIGALSTGVDFVVRNGTVLAKTGDVIASGSTETWSDVVLGRTFAGFASNGNDSVIMGLTNNADLATDNVAVWKNGAQSQVLFREGQPMTLNNRQFYVGFIPANRGQSWITADRKFVTLVTLYEGSNVCTNLFNNTISALVSVDLPATGPTCNNPSNVAGANQSTTPDASLTADDIIVFLGWYFAGNPLADVAGPNQSSTPDGAFTADDIIVFLGRYFQGC